MGEGPSRCAVSEIRHRKPLERLMVNRERCGEGRVRRRRSKRSHCTPPQLEHRRDSPPDSAPPHLGHGPGGRARGFGGGRARISPVSCFGETVTEKSSSPGTPVLWASFCTEVRAGGENPMTCGLYSSGFSLRARMMSTTAPNPRKLRTTPVIGQAPDCESAAEVARAAERPAPGARLRGCARALPVVDERAS